MSGLAVPPTFPFEKSRPAAFARLPDFVEPMKARLVDSIRPGNCIYEIKFDGYRALALRGGTETRVPSRNEKDLGGKFPEVKDSIAALNVQDAIKESHCSWNARIAEYSSFQPSSSPPVPLSADRTCEM